MPGKSSLTNAHIQRILKERDTEELRTRLSPDLTTPLRVLSSGSGGGAAAVASRWKEIGARSEARDAVLDVHTREHLKVYGESCENVIGSVKIPVGIVGPLRVNGIHAKGDYFIPLATSESALIASYHRGCGAISLAGGCTSMVLSEMVNRAPAFAFRTLPEAGEFVAWAMGQLEIFQSLTNETTRHGQLLDIGTTVEGNHVYLNFEFSTGDAAGQNMVTFATAHICQWILENSPVKPGAFFVEGNLSGDKKASAQAFTSVRGKKVAAEVVIPRSLAEAKLQATPAQLVKYWQMSALGGVLSGTLGVQGHYANGLAALYLATGQDAACVAESAIGVTRFELTESSDLYASVTLPGIMVGTVGGGTHLPAQRACLEIMGLAGEGHSRALAEVCAGLLLGGELSIIAALAAGQFSRAHQVLGRKRHRQARSR